MKIVLILKLVTKQGEVSRATNKNVGRSLYILNSYKSANIPPTHKKRCSRKTFFSKKYIIFVVAHKKVIIPFF